MSVLREEKDQQYSYSEFLLHAYRLKLPSFKSSWLSKMRKLNVYRVSSLGRQHTMRLQKEVKTDWAEGMGSGSQLEIEMFVFSSVGLQLLSI